MLLWFFARWITKTDHAHGDRVGAITTASVTAAQVSLWKHRGLQIMEANLREQGFA